MDELEVLCSINWLFAVRQPCHEPDVAVVPALGDFFEHVYQSSYEDWCVQDHHAAQQIPGEHRGAVEEVARRAHEQAWSRCPQPEVCALVYDDAYTIGALLLLTSGRLSLFTQQRLGWYQRGRVPCGYQGAFSAGQWFIL